MERREEGRSSGGGGLSARREERHCRSKLKEENAMTSAESVINKLAFGLGWCHFQLLLTARPARQSTGICPADNARSNLTGVGYCDGGYVLRGGRRLVVSGSRDQCITLAPSLERPLVFVQSVRCPFTSSERQTAWQC